VTLDLRNFLAEGLPGRQAYFTSSLGAFEGQVIDHGDGTYSQDFRPGTQSGTARIAALVQDRIESTGMPASDDTSENEDDGAVAPAESVITKINRAAEVTMKAAPVDAALCDLQLSSGLEFLYRGGADRVRLIVKDSFGNIVEEPASVVFYLVEPNGSMLEGDVEMFDEGVYEQSIVASSGYVTTVVGASVNGANVGEILELPVFDSPPWSSDCDGDGFPDEGHGLKCRSMEEWWSPVGSYDCNYDTAGLECDAPVAEPVDSAFYWRPGVRAFDVDAGGHVVILRAALLEILQPDMGRTGMSDLLRSTVGTGCSDAAMGDGSCAAVEAFLRQATRSRAGPCSFQAFSDDRFR